MWVLIIFIMFCAAVFLVALVHGAAADSNEPDSRLDTLGQKSGRS